MSVRRVISCPNCGDTLPVDVDLSDVIKHSRQEALKFVIHRYRAGDHRRDEAFLTRFLIELILALTGSDALSKVPINLKEFEASRFIPERDLKRGAI